MSDVKITNPKHPMWKRVDWKKTNVVLQRELADSGKAISYFSLSKVRRKLGVPKARWKWKNPSPRRLVDPSIINWNLNDILLSRIHNITRERIRQLRINVGFKSKGVWNSAGSRVAALESLLFEDVVRNFGESNQVNITILIRIYSRWFASINPVKRRLEKWMVTDKMHPLITITPDFRLPSGVLSHIWKCRQSYISVRRRLAGQPQPIIKGVGVFHKYLIGELPENIREIVEQEKERSAEYYHNKNKLWKKRNKPSEKTVSKVAAQMLERSVEIVDTWTPEELDDLLKQHLVKIPKTFAGKVTEASSISCALDRMKNNHGGAAT